MSAVPVDPVRAPTAYRDLIGDAIPPWVIAATRDRWEGWRAAHPDETAGPGLVFSWVLEVCQLPPGYRRALDVLTTLQSGTWPDAKVHERIGYSAWWWRVVVRPNLVAWGWLTYVHGRNQHGGAYTVTVPGELPPDRCRVPGRARPGSVDNFRKGAQEPTRATRKNQQVHLAQEPTGAARKNQQVQVSQEPTGAARKNQQVPRARTNTKVGKGWEGGGTGLGEVGTQGPVHNTPSSVKRPDLVAVACPRCSAGPGEPCVGARGKVLPVTHTDRRAR